MRSRIATILAGALLLASAAPAQKKDIDLDVKAPDGAKIKATYYSPGKLGPGMILLHQCNMDRKSWVSLAGALAAKGVHVLTLDYRGYGESDERTDDRARIQQLGEKWPADVDAAFSVLLAQPGVDKTRIAAGGASCGVHQSIQLARRSGQIKALMLLSGSTRSLSEGTAYLAGNPLIPIFGAASAEDGNAVQTMRGIVGLSKHSATTIRELNNAGHGVPMFAADPALLPSIVAWLAQALR